MPLIRKYENRRLYDTSASRYVNLDDLVRMVRAGDDVRVEDAKTGRDLTREILLQILLEHPAAGELLPVPLLRRIIRSSGDEPMQRALRAQITTGLDMVHAQLDRIEGQLFRLYEGSGPDAWRAAFAVWDPFMARARGGGTTTGPGHTVSEPEPPPYAAAEPAPPPDPPVGAPEPAPDEPPPATRRRTKEPAAAAAPPESPADDLDALRRKLDALERRLRSP